MNRISNYIIMDHEYSGDESPHTLDENMVNIKDYSQNENSEPEQDSPFDELEHILGQDENRQSRNELHLAEKYKQLEQKCNAVKQKNHYLDQQITDLHSDIRDYDQLTQEDSLQNDLIEAVQKQLADFKASFEEFRAKQMKITQEKDGEIQRLRQELDKLSEERISIEEEKIGLAQSNDDLSRTNQNLILEIQKLETELAQSRTEINSSRSYRFSSRRDHGFQSEVQAELQILIEKLMSELELERNHKRRLNDEMKRMQKETMLLEKEITHKNNKIYELEMSNLKQNRTSKTNLTTLKSYEERTLKYSRPSRSELNNKSDRSQSSLKTLNLMQLLNSNDQVSDRQRLIISAKLIDFYARKINSKDFACYQLQNLMICNFNRSNPNLISIRKDANLTPSSDVSQEKMLFNLGEVLDILLGDYLNEVKQQDSGQQYLLNLINQILNEKSINVNDIYVIKQLIEDCLKSRK